MEIGHRIELLRKEKQVTQQQLADYLSVLPQTVSRWESGGTPDVTLLPKIALFFGVSIDELFGMNNMEKAKELAIRYGVLRDEKSYEDADRTLSLEYARAEEEKNDADRKTILAYRMHLYLQKGWQFLSEAERTADRLIAETESSDDPWHLPARLQKMQLKALGAKPVEYIRNAAEDYKDDPNMETLQLYFLALMTVGQVEKVLSEASEGYARDVLSKQDKDSLTVWEILFQAAAGADDLGFFEAHFEEYKSLKKAVTGSDNCLEMRMLLAGCYAARGMNKEKEACKEILLHEVETIDNELMLNNAVERIKAL